MRALRALARPPSLLAALAVVALGPCLVACQGNKTGFGMDNAGQLPNVKVDLPAVPSFEGGPVPLSYPDGTLSVVGLKRRMEKFLKQEVKVKGYVVDIYVCPPEIKSCKGLTCKNCEKPHFYLGDAADAPVTKSLIVSDYPEPGQKVIPGEPGAGIAPPKITKGEQVVVDASYDISSLAGFKSSDGVLSLKSVTDANGAPPAAH